VDAKAAVGLESVGVPCLTFIRANGQSLGMMIATLVYLVSFSGVIHLYAAELDFIPAPNSPFRAETGGHNLVVADLNEDQKPDLLVSGGANLTVLIGEGGGRFHPAANMPISLAHGASEMAIGDFNGDGHLDWAGAHHDHYDVIFLLGKGTGQFEASPGSPYIARAAGKRAHTHALVAGDVNNDGKLDLVTANNEDDDVSVLLGDGRGRFTPSPKSPFPVGRSPYPLALADVNSDRNLDIIAPNSAPDVRTATVLLGDGLGAFRAAPHSPFSTAGAAFFVCAADVNSDKTADLIITHSGLSTVTLLLGSGDGNFKSAPGSPIDLGNQAWGIIAADLDRDGHLDLTAAGQNAVAILRGDGRGGFKPVAGSPFPTGGKGCWRPVLGDFNSDGKLDIVVGNVETDNISVLLAK
jgi:hypothetical protein